MTFEDRIVLDPAIRGGKPCIKGTRITVYDILEYLAGGMSDDQILNDFQFILIQPNRLAKIAPLHLDRIREAEKHLQHPRFWLPAARAR